jgi:hypothetical protein
MLVSFGMNVAISSPKPVSRSPKHTDPPAEDIGSAQALAEIAAYAAIRDELLIEAEELKTRAKLDSVTIANDFVQGCLNPARAPYQSQSLPEPEAARHRKRCQAVKKRVAELQAGAV